MGKVVTPIQTLNIKKAFNTLERKALHQRRRRRPNDEKTFCFSSIPEKIVFTNKLTIQDLMQVSCKSFKQTFQKAVREGKPKQMQVSTKTTTDETPKKFFSNKNTICVSVFSRCIQVSVFVFCSSVFMSKLSAYIDKYAMCLKQLIVLSSPQTSCVFH
jgi:hypothetical protein